MLLTTAPLSLNMDGYKDIVIYAVNVIICCAVITLISFLGGGLCRDLANAQSADLVAEERLSIYRNFGCVNSQTITGYDVIALMRENTIDGAAIIKVDTSTIGALTMNADNYQSSMWTLSSLKAAIPGSALYYATATYDEETGQENITLKKV